MRNIIWGTNDHPLSLGSEFSAGICAEVEALAETASEASMRKSARCRPRRRSDEQEMRQFSEYGSSNSHILTRLFPLFVKQRERQTCESFFVG